MGVSSGSVWKNGSFEKQTISESTNIEEPRGIMGNGMNMNEVGLALEDLSAWLVDLEL